MSDDQVKVEFKTTYDGKGAEQANQGIRSAQTSAGKAATGFAGLKNSVTAVSQAMEVVGKVSRGLGIVAVITGIIATVQGLKKWFDEAAAAARKIKLEKIGKENETAVKGIAREYEAMLKTIDAVNMAILRQRELEAARLKNKRDMEDVEADMQQQDEIDKLDRKDPLYREKSGEIRARYKSMATERQSGREYEDLQVKQQAEDDNIKKFRTTEMEERSVAEKKWGEYSRQQKQIEDLQKPVVKTRDVYRSAGASGAMKVGTEQYEDEAATKQNRDKAKKLSEDLEALEKEARKHVALADEAGKQAAQAAQIAATLSQAKSVSLGKANLSTRVAASERADAYESTDLARMAYEKEQEEKRKRDSEEAAKKQDEEYNQKAIPHIMQAETAAEAARQKVSDARIAEKAAEEARAIKVADFEESGSRNTTVFKKSLAPLDAGVTQARAGREAAEREAKAAVAALDQLLSTYGNGFKEMTSKINRAIVQQKLDASGGQ